MALQTCLYGSYIAQVTVAIPSGPFFAGFKPSGRDTLQNTLDGIIHWIIMGCINHYHCSKRYSPRSYSEVRDKPARRSSERDEYRSHHIPLIQTKSNISRRVHSLITRKKYMYRTPIKNSINKSKKKKKKKHFSISQNTRRQSKRKKKKRT